MDLIIINENGQAPRYALVVSKGCILSSTFNKDRAGVFSEEVVNQVTDFYEKRKNKIEGISINVIPA